jgi:hypothetical protein
LDAGVARGAGGFRGFCVFAFGGFPVAHGHGVTRVCRGAPKAAPSTEGMGGQQVDQKNFDKSTPMLIRSSTCVDGAVNAVNPERRNTILEKSSTAAAAREGGGQEGPAPTARSGGSVGER